MEIIIVFNLHCTHLTTITKESKIRDLKNSIYFKSLKSSFQAETVPFCWFCHLHFSSDAVNTSLSSNACISPAFYILSFIYLRQYLATWSRLVLHVNFYLLWETLLVSGYTQLQAKICHIIVQFCRKIVKLNLLLWLRLFLFSFSFTKSKYAL